MFDTHTPRLATLAGALVLVCAVAPAARAQDLGLAVDAFWAADAGDEDAINQAVEAILALDPEIEPLWTRVRAGATYDADMPRGRQLLSHENADGVEYRYVVHVPDDYDSTRRYPVRVYLHGGVSRPRRDEARFWRNEEPYVRADSLVVFPESWAESMWWQASQIDALAGMLVDLKQRYNVDENAVYLMGVSDGATGVFYHAFKASTPWAGFLSFNGPPRGAGQSVDQGDWSDVCDQPAQQAVLRDQRGEGPSVSGRVGRAILPAVRRCRCLHRFPATTRGRPQHAMVDRREPEYRPVHRDPSPGGRCRTGWSGRPSPPRGSTGRTGWSSPSSGVSRGRPASRISTRSRPPRRPCRSGSTCWASWRRGPVSS